MIRVTGISGVTGVSVGVRSRNAVIRSYLSSVPNSSAWAARSKVVVAGRWLRSASLVSSRARQERSAIVPAMSRPAAVTSAATSSTSPARSASAAVRRAPA